MTWSSDTAGLFWKRNRRDRAIRRRARTLVGSVWRRKPPPAVALPGLGGATEPRTLMAIGTPTSIGTTSGPSTGTSLAWRLPSAQMSRLAIQYSSPLPFMLRLQLASLAPTLWPSRIQKGNSWTQDAVIQNPNGADEETCIVSALITSALVQNTDKITLSNFDSGTDTAAISAFQVSGLFPPADVTMTHFVANATTATVSTGTTGMTSQANELVFAVFGVDGDNGSFSSLTSGYTGLNSVVSIGAPTSVLPAYQAVTSAGTFSASVTYSPAHFWAAAIATYEAGTPFIWTGKSTLDSNWSDGTNWAGGVAPSSGSDVLIFPSGASQSATNTDNIPSLSVASVEFTGTGYSISANGGDTLTLTGNGGVGIDNTSGTEYVRCSHYSWQ